jgi:hypothetical protein
MEIALTLLSILGVGALPLLGIVFMIKRRNTTTRQSITPIAQEPRYRDGATMYNQFRGVRFNIELEDPRQQESSRYQRRHPRKQNKSTKPWKKNL